MTQPSQDPHAPNPWKKAWEATHELGSILYLCRFSWIMLALTMIILLCVDQGEELLRDLPSSRSLWLVQKVQLFVLATVLWATASWYWARQILQFRFPHMPPTSHRIDCFREWVPRVLGTLGLLFMALALFLASRAYAGTSQRDQSQLEWLAGIFAGLSAVFFLVVTYRRKLHLWLVQLSRRFRLRIYLFGKGPKLRSVQAFSKLPKESRRFLYSTLILACMLFVIFMLNPILIAPKIGGANILMLATASWIPVGTYLLILSTRYRFPIISASLLMAVLFSLWNDNHAVRVLWPGANRPPIPTLEQWINRWFEARKADILQEGKGRYPVFIVASAGGGIRAAYWTASVLGALEDQDPEPHHGFSSHVIATSGVSGGSLGNAVFTASTAQAFEQGNVSHLTGASSQFQQKAIRMLGQDLLSPALASMLYPDAVQRFFFFPVPFVDRARTLEGTWEMRWLETFQDKRFSAPMDDLWKRDYQCKVPAIFLNATSVETGRRMIVSNLSIDPTDFPDAIGTRDLMGCEFPLSAAVHMSARFTYVSPAGTLRDSKGRMLGHVVDGGYFENSGAATANDVLQAIQVYLRTHRDLTHRVMPVVILIGNDPKAPIACDGAYAPGLGAPSRFMGETFSPILTLLATRSARGRFAEAAIKEMAEDDADIEGKVFCVSPKDRGVPLPLGWSLARSSKLEMDDQIDGLRQNPSTDALFGGVHFLLQRPN